MALWKKLLARRSRGRRCSFCNKSQRDVLKLVAGPLVNICNECVAICTSLVAEDEKAHLQKALASGDALACLLCGKVKASADLLHLPNRGPVCFVCVAMIKVAAGPRWDFRAE